MSQNWESNLYTTGTVVDTTMSNMELMFATLKSSFSGTSAPASAVAGQVWYDSNASYYCLQVRNAGNTAWRGVMTGSSSCYVWVYLNAAEEGWTIRAELTTDCVLGVKKTGGTYDTGAAEKGTWTISGLSSHTAHNHQWYDDSGGTVHGIGVSVGTRQSYNSVGTAISFNVAIDMYTDNETVAAHTHDGTWRVKAAVGIMVKPNARG